MDELGECQKANGGEFIGAVRDTNVRRIFEEEIAKGEICSMTIDFFQPGEMQPDRDHNFIANNSRVQERQGRKSRIVRSGWISFDMEWKATNPSGLRWNTGPVSAENRLSISLWMEPGLRRRIFRIKRTVSS